MIFALVISGLSVVALFTIAAGIWRAVSSSRPATPETVEAVTEYLKKIRSAKQ
jgi:hypothetical protein